MEGRTEEAVALDPYVPRVALRRLVNAPADLVQTVEGTVVFTDVSGFTRLSERLARRGTEGAENLVDTINSCFSTLLADAYANGGLDSCGRSCCSHCRCTSDLRSVARLWRIGIARVRNQRKFPSRPRSGKVSSRACRFRNSLGCAC